jgi:hypothetical protein
MTSKRTVKRTRSGQGGELERLRKLSRRAQAEVARLIERDRTGTITRVQLQTGLKEVGEQLKLMNLHFLRL